MWKLTCISLLFIHGITLISSKAVPSYITVCRQSDPKLDECIENSVRALIPRLRDGLPDLDVQPLEPFSVTDVIISRNFGPNLFLLNLTDIALSGITDFQVESLKLDLPNTIFTVNLTFPKLQLKGNYAVDTRILALPIITNGEFEVNGTDIRGGGHLIGQLIQDQFERLHLSDLTINVKIGDFKLLVNNAIGKDDVITQAINDLAVQNKDEFIELATPYIESEAKNAVLPSANQILKNLEYDKILPK